MAVDIAFQLPENVATKLKKQGADLSRLSFEKLVCSLYRDGELTHKEAMEALGLPGRFAMDDVLQRHNMHREWPLEEFEADLRTTEKLRKP
jgi:hypothetical protein